MPLVRTLRRRGTTITVEAHGELLFVPGGDIANWKRRFSNSVRRFAAAEAPRNKRPRWAHYGKPLKQTMRASTDADPARMRVDSVVGSTAAHSYYVDQGTGIYNGSGPYVAKVLPPWTRGSPSLYEHTWKPPGYPGHKMHTVIIKGQRGQFFMATALNKAMAAAGLLSFDVPVQGIDRVFDTFPEGLPGFLGNTPADASFRASLTEWRAWRDAAFNAGKMLGRDNNWRSRRRTEPKVRPPRRKQPKSQWQIDRDRRNAAERARRYRERQRANQRDRQKPVKTSLQVAIAAAKVEMAAWLQRHPGYRITGYNSNGFSYVDPRGKRRMQPWKIRTADLFIEAGQSSDDGRYDPRLRGR